MLKRTEQNLIVRSGKSEAELTNIIEDCARRIVLLRQEASHGLSATVEILVFIPSLLDASVRGVPGGILP